MAKAMQLVQLTAWLMVASYFALLISERVQIKPAKNDIVAQLEQQVNFSLENEE